MCRSYTNKNQVYEGRIATCVKGAKGGKVRVTIQWERLRRERSTKVHVGVGRNA